MREKELKLTQQLIDLQKQFNDMVRSRDYWRNVYFDMKKEKEGRENVIEGLHRDIEVLKQKLTESKRECRRLEKELDFYIGE